MKKNTNLEIERYNKLKAIETIQGSGWKENKKNTDNSTSLLKKYQRFSKKHLEKLNKKVTVSCRVLTKRGPFIEGKDFYGKIQGYVNKKAFPKVFAIFKLIDTGDIVQMSGTISKSNVNVLMIKLKKITVLAKTLKAIEKFHNLNDVEQRYRKRYLDLLINEETKTIFKTRTKIISLIRDFFNSQDYYEVDTPVLQSFSIGAAAKPFATYHNSLRSNLYLRIATEIPLKKLLVGGFEKVYEIGRVFRNEGIDTSHNPEFTTIEFYEAYSNLKGMMNKTEQLIKFIARKLKVKKLMYKDQEVLINKKFQIIKMIDSLNNYLKLDVNKLEMSELKELAKQHEVKVKPFYEKGHIIGELFDKLIAVSLVQPTFVIDFPIEISPLALSYETNKNITQRAELYICGKEYANMFGELNNPQEQLKRLKKQIKEKNAGNDEASDIDYDFIEALEYGMPPAGGCGIGIDRLIMLFVNKYSIREVLLFPHLKGKKERK